LKTIIRWTLQQRRWYTVWWTLGVTAFIALELAFYPSFKNQAAQLNQAFQQIPPAVKALIGDSGNYFSPDSYLNSRVFYLVVPLLFAILMIGLGSSLLAREEQDGTIELLLARPIKRGGLLLGKALSGLIITGMIALVGLISCIVLSKAVGLPNTVYEISAAMLLSYLLCLVFGAFAFMLTAVSGVTRGLAIGLSTFLFVASYVLTGLSTAVHWLTWPAKFLPYYHFDPQQMLSGHFTWKPVIGYTLAIVVFYFIGWLGFRRRDIS